jgi:starch-binding outer membrane protein, SusD/RagB family
MFIQNNLIMRKMKLNILNWLSSIILILLITGCDKNYLDVVPDNIATIEDAFSMRTNAEKYLFTCYSYLPKHGEPSRDPAMMGADELWGYVGQGVAPGRTDAYFDHVLFDIAQGFQNKIDPKGGFYWDELYQGIRCCNIFLENIEEVPDMVELEKRQWISEVKFLKAYYHFYLIKMYGPIPIVDKSLPIDASVEEVRVSRQPVDSCFNFVVDLLSDAVGNLPQEITDPYNESGRITQPIALALKAKVRLFQASPLFNGNNDFSALANNDGTKLFPVTFSEEKWVVAAEACMEAIDLCENLGYKLYKFQEAGKVLSDTLTTQMSLRNSVCDKWNSELIWGNSQSWAALTQQLSTAVIDPSDRSNTSIKTEFAVPLKIADLFYTNNGVPIEEDKTWDYNSRYNLKTATEDDYPNLQVGYTTVNYNFNRENRYYSSLGFDGGTWYGQGKYKENDLWNIQSRFGQVQNLGALTGNYAKKLVHYENVQSPGRIYSINQYPWPVIRLSDLYLMYAEASNEAYGPNGDAKSYINKVRERAGLTGVDESWAAYSTNPTKPNSKEGLREIIRQERMIELAFEGKRFWDIRRWKIAASVMNADIVGWSVSQETPEAFYTPQVLFTQSFSLKDYFFPIKDSYIIRNRNLVQNLGW